MELRYDIAGAFLACSCGTKDRFLVRIVPDLHRDTGLVICRNCGNGYPIGYVAARVASYTRRCNPHDKPKIVRLSEPVKLETF